MTNNDSSVRHSSAPMMTNTVENYLAPAGVNEY